jgi:uncharacterized membrane protein
MSQLREPAFDRAVAMVLRVGAFGCFFIMLAGLIAGLFLSGRVPLGIERAGVLLMLATPVVRVMVACFLFFSREGFQVRMGVPWCAGDLNAGSGIRNWGALAKRV